MHHLIDALPVCRVLLLAVVVSAEVRVRVGLVLVLVGVAADAVVHVPLAVCMGQCVDVSVRGSAWL